MKRIKFVLIILSTLFFYCVTGCSGTGPALIEVPEYQPDKKDKLELPLPEPEFELPALPPPAEEAEPETVIRYIISPDEGYADASSYLRLSYEHDETGGEITVHIGHREIDGANTKWYSYLLLVDGKRYTKQGRVSVPFVRGRDNFWWNEEEIVLPVPIEKEAEITVFNEYNGEELVFLLKKEVIEL